MARKNLLEAVGYFSLGLGFAYQGAKALGWFGLGAADVFSDVPEGAWPQDAPRVIERVENRIVNSIEDRVRYIQRRIRDDSAKPRIRELALAILTGKTVDEDGRVRWQIDEKDYEGEIIALFDAVRDPGSPVGLRYTRDHAEIDQFHAADKLLALKGGDCDDGCILLGSLLRAVGFPVRLRVIQDTKSRDFSHIYLLAGAPPGDPTKWIPLDWSMPGKPAGWEAPGAARVARTGRPAGVVTKLADFAV